MELLKDRPDDLRQQVDWANEFEDLFGRAFADSDELDIGLLSKGGGGSFVLVVTPQAGGYTNQPMIVKCGRGESIAGGA